MSPCTNPKVETLISSFVCLYECLTTSQVFTIRNGDDLCTLEDVCSSLWGCRHLGTALCEQLQSLPLVSTQLWKTRWVLLALAASLGLSLWLQTNPTPITCSVRIDHFIHTLMYTQLPCWLVFCMLNVFWRKHVSVLLLLSAIFPQARAAWMGPFGPTDFLSEWEMECA